MECFLKLASWTIFPATFVLRIVGNFRKQPLKLTSSNMPTAAGLTGTGRLESKSEYLSDSRSRSESPENKKCEHYERKCSLLADCCGKFYPCRICHDESTDHMMDRYSVEKVKCRECGVVQDISPRCVNRDCHVREFASYYCAICHLFDSSGDAIYHCDQCKLCRKGKREENYHCVTCGVCITLQSKSVHFCRKSSFDASCPLCLEYLKTTREQAVLPRCGHAIHLQCLQDWKKSHYTCPICQKSLANMEPFFQQLDAVVADDRQQMPHDLRTLSRKVFCNDCASVSSANFHHCFLKCNNTLVSGGSCGSYNTRLL